MGYVPIKLDNERLPEKHFLPLSGRPLLVHVFEALRRVIGLDAVYAWTSAPRLAEYLPEGVQLLLRDPAFDGSTVKGLDLFTGFAQAVPAEWYVLAHATAPYLRTETIQRGVDAVLSGAYDSALSAHAVRTYCWHGGKPVNYDPRDMARTQDLASVLVETSGFYMYSRAEILERHRRIGDRPLFVEVPFWEAIDIDYREDYELALRFQDRLAGPA